MKRVALVLLLLILFSAPTTVAQVPDDKLIVPGQRIGKWTLEMTMQDLRRINGPGFCIVLPANPTSVGTPFACFWITNPLTVLTRDQRRVESIGILGSASLEEAASSFKTEKAVGIGSSKADAITAFGSPTGIATKLSVYDELGIAFLIERDQVSSIDVFRTGTASSIWRVQPTTQAPISPPQIPPTPPTPQPPRDPP